MPRMTRAQLRAQEAGKAPQIHEDPATDSATQHGDSSPFSIDLSARPALQEIHINKTPAGEQTETQRKSPYRKAEEFGREKTFLENKIEPAPSKNEDLVATPPHNFSQGNSPSDTSSATDLAGEGVGNALSTHEKHQMVDILETPTKPRCVAPSAVENDLNTRTPRFDPVVHSAMPSAARSSGSKTEDSFVGSIKSRTPAIVGKSQQATGDESDSFVEDITSRSPSKYAARIEDSVEAIDALEEAIEQVSEELPHAIAANVDSPLKATMPKVAAGMEGSDNRDLASSEPDTKSAEIEPTTSAPGPVTRSSPPHSAVTRRLSTVQARRGSTFSTNQPQRASIASMPSKNSAPSNVQTATAGVPASGKRKNGATLSTSKPPFVPSKSAKAPTKSTFTLPGDVISARMKAQREERLKQQEAETEAARKRAGFKARPMPQTLATIGKGQRGSVVPRENATSRARMSLMAAKKENGDGAIRKDSVPFGGRSKFPKASSAGTRTSMTPSATGLSGLAVQKTRTSAPAGAGAEAGNHSKKPSKTSVPANSSAVRRTSQTQKSLLHSRPRPSNGGAVGKADPSGSAEVPLPTLPSELGLLSAKTTTTVPGTLKGKAVFSRPKIASEEFQRQKREKEEATRKARAEAAERGRLASRQWAAQRQAQKEKKMQQGKEMIEEERA